MYSKSFVIPQAHLADWGVSKYSLDNPCLYQFYKPGLESMNGKMTWYHPLSMKNNHWKLVWSGDMKLCKRV